MNFKLLPLLLLLAACQPDQVQHLPGTKQIAEETANWEVLRILPHDLLHATRWAGDSLTGFADTLLRRTLARELAAGGVAQAAAFCRPETYPRVDSMARKWQAAPRRVEWQPAPTAGPGASAAAEAAGLQPDTLRLIGRPAADTFFYQRPIVLRHNLCLRCHGQPGRDLTAAEAALLHTRFPALRATGRQVGQVLGAWQLTLAQSGVAEFYTMKTRKKWKPHKMPKLF
ncbi:MAG: c-type heme family protein [Janthinobacterium lividum]